VTKLPIVSLIALSMLNSSPVKSNSDVIPYYIYNAATAFKLDVALLFAVCTQESLCKAKAINKNDGNKATKARGIKERSHGLFQLKLATARGLGFTGSRAELMDPETNTWYAAKLIRTLYDKFKTTDKVLSAYNAGHYTTANKRYVDSVLRHYAHYKLDRRF
jgi:soluble lytic murein transglycosylase-like protein